MVPRLFDRPLADSFLIGGLGLLLLHARLEAAALDHEVRDDAVEDGAVVELVIDVGEEVLHRDRRLVRVQLDLDRAQRRFHDDDVVLGHVRSSGAGEKPDGTATRARRTVTRLRRRGSTR